MAKKRQSYTHTSSPPYLSKDNNLFFDVLILAWISIFFIFIISNLYPQMAYVPSNDIVRHLSASKGLILAPDIYGSEYPWFHFTWALVNEFSAPPMWLFQSGIAYLSIMLMFSFYSMAKVYLHDIDRRAPILSTIFFFVFSGFGWFFFIQKVLGTSNVSEHFHITRHFE